MQANILIVDDNKELVDLVKIALINHEYQVIEASGASEVELLLVNSADKAQLDLILLDLMLPDQDGFALYDRFRLHPYTAETPIVILSALNNIQTRVQLLDLGANDYIVKPFSVNELLTRIAIHIQLNQLRRAKQVAEAQIETQNRYLAAINEIGHDAAQYLDLQMMLEGVSQAIVAHFACEACAIYLCHPDTEVLFLATYTRAVLMPSTAVPSLVSHCISQQKTIHVASQTAVPLLRDDVALGVLLIENSSKKSLLTEAIRALEILATQLTTAITNAYLFQDIQHRNHQLESIAAENTRLLRLEQQQRRQAEELQQMAHILSSSLDMQDVLAAAIESIRTMIQVETGSILLLDKKNNRLTFAGSLQSNPALEEAHLDAGEGIVGYVIQYATPIIVNDAPDHPMFFPKIDKMTGLITHSILCVPLIARDRVVGAIELVNKLNGEFTEMDLTLVNSAATSIAVAIDNARLYQEQANLIQQIQRSQAQLVQSEKLGATGRLAASLAHEINNPLQAIHSCLQLAVYFELGQEKQAEYLQMASEEVERLIDIVSRILDFSRPSSGTFQLINVNKIIGQVMQLAGKHIAHHRWNVQQNLASDVPSLYMIPDQIAQVFLSIILNAFDAMPEKGVLTITSRSRKEWVEIVFADNGVGMKPEVAVKIFEPFFTTKDKHSGLGLSICYGIVERHGGVIHVESEVDKGTVFTISLPRFAKSVSN